MIGCTRGSIIAADMALSVDVVHEAGPRLQRRVPTHRRPRRRAGRDLQLGGRVGMKPSITLQRHKEHYEMPIHSAVACLVGRSLSNAIRPHIRHGRRVDDSQ